MMKRINNARADFAACEEDIGNLLKMVAENVIAYGRKNQEIDFGNLGDMKIIRGRLMEILMYMNLPDDMYEQDFLGHLEDELIAKRKKK